MKYLITLTLFLLPIITLAAPQYTPIVGLPGVPTDASFDTYINALYGLSISIAALLAVIKIVIAGVKYMLTDIVTSKGAAKEDIKGALLGLLIVIGAVLILTVINPNLANVNIPLLGQGKATCDSCITSLDTSGVNTSLIYRQTFPNGAGTIESFPTTATAEEITAFVSYCTTGNHTLYTLGTSKKCVKEENDSYEIVSRDNTVPNTELACTNDSDDSPPGIDGTYIKDNKDSAVGWCAYLKD